MTSQPRAVRDEIVDHPGVAPVSVLLVMFVLMTATVAVWTILVTGPDVARHLRQLAPDFGRLVALALAAVALDARIRPAAAHVRAIRPSRAPPPTVPLRERPSLFDDDHDDGPDPRV